MFSMVGKYPVLEGVFSFMLWGTCRGRKEPTYYNKVSLCSTVLSLQSLSFHCLVLVLSLPS